MIKGFIRRVNKLGRIVIPKEIRDILDIQDNDCLEMYLEDDHIVLKKYQPYCIFCKKLSPSIEYGQYSVCKDCIEKLQELKVLIEE